VQIDVHNPVPGFVIVRAERYPSRNTGVRHGNMHPAEFRDRSLHQSVDVGPNADVNGLDDAPTPVRFYVTAHDFNIVFVFGVPRQRHVGPGRGEASSGGRTDSRSGSGNHGHSIR
jgi:hypothetical protein